MVDISNYKKDIPCLSRVKTVLVDVYHFDPSSISVVANGKMIVISGSHSEQVDELGYASRSFQRIYRLGENVQSKSISVVINPARFMLIRYLDSDECGMQQKKIKSVENYISPDNVGILFAASTIQLNNALADRVEKAWSGCQALQVEMNPTESQRDHSTAIDPNLAGPSGIQQHRRSERRPGLRDPNLAGPSGIQQHRRSESRPGLRDPNSPGPSGIKQHRRSESFSEREFEQPSESFSEREFKPPSKSLPEVFRQDFLNSPEARFEQLFSESSSKGGLKKGKGKYKAVCKPSERLTYILPTASISTAAAPDCHSMPSTTETSDLPPETDQGTIAQWEFSAQNIKKRASDDQPPLHTDHKRPREGDEDGDGDEE